MKDPSAHMGVKEEVPDTVSDEEWLRFEIFFGRAAVEDDNWCC